MAGALHPATKPPAALEQCYSVQEIATAWRLSPDTIIRMFREEPGVLSITRRPHSRAKSNVKLRIPVSVFERVERRMKESGS